MIIKTFGTKGNQVTFIIDGQRIIILEDPYQGGLRPTCQLDVYLEKDDIMALGTDMIAEAEGLNDEVP